MSEQKFEPIPDSIIWFDGAFTLSWYNDKCFIFLEKKKKILLEKYPGPLKMKFKNFHELYDYLQNNMLLNKINK